MPRPWLICFAPIWRASGIVERVEIVDHHACCGFVRSKSLLRLEISRLAGCGYVVDMLRITAQYLGLRAPTATLRLVPLLSAWALVGLVCRGSSR
jgi:hypothetical protein